MKVLTWLILATTLIGCASVSTLAINYPNSPCAVTKAEVKRHIEATNFTRLGTQVAVSFTEVNRTCASALKVPCSAVGCTVNDTSQYWVGLRGAHRVDIIAHEYYHQMEFMRTQGRVVNETAAVLFGKRVARELCGANTN